MRLCPISLAVGCAQCIVVAICPLKEWLGDYQPPRKTITHPKRKMKKLGKKKLR